MMIADQLWRRRYRADPVGDRHDRPRGRHAVHDCWRDAGPVWVSGQRENLAADDGVPVRRRLFKRGITSRRGSDRRPPASIVDTRHGVERNWGCSSPARRQFPVRAPADAFASFPSRNSRRHARCCRASGCSSRSWPWCCWWPARTSRTCSSRAPRLESRDIAIRTALGASRTRLSCSSSVNQRGSPPAPRFWAWRCAAAGLRFFRSESAAILRRSGWTSASMPWSRVLRRAWALSRRLPRDLFLPSAPHAPV